MNKIVYDLLLKLEQCDDKHNRCDYLMEHDEITYLLEHIEEKDKEIERLKEWKKDLLDENINLENIRKEANEFIKEHTNNFAEYLDVYEAKELSNILEDDKDEKKEENTIRN